MAANTSDEQNDKVPLRVLVDKEKEKVVYAEAWKDFVDVLLSFFTLPLGTIARIVAKESNIEPVRVGSLSSLYESVADLKEEYLFNQTCKEMLLKPMNSMEANCRHMKLNIDDREPTQYFICGSPLECFAPVGAVTTFRNQECCNCDWLMDRVVFPDDRTARKGFAKETDTLIIADDLYVMPNDIGTSLQVLQMHGINDIEAIERKTILIGKKEVVDILKLSLLSKTPLTDFIFKKKQLLDNFNPGNQSEFEIGDVTSDKGRKIDVKVMVRKSNGEIMFAEAGVDFADFLFSFLTFPLGGVLHMLEGISTLGCLDNLYKSFRVSKNGLAMTGIAQPFQLKNQILPIDVAPLPRFYQDDMAPLPRFFQDDELVELYMMDPKSYSSGGYAASGPIKFMVTDDLVVTPMSSISGISYLERMKVPLNDLEERVISIGKKEGLVILKAALTSTSALTKAVDLFGANLISKAALTDSPSYPLKNPKEENEA